MTSEQSRVGLIIKFGILISILPWILILLTSVDWNELSSGEIMVLIIPLGNTIGLIGLTFIIWQFILGSRFLIRKITKDTILFNGIHQFLGTYGLLLVFLHPLMETIEEESDLSFIYAFSFGMDSKETAISFGRLAYFIFVLIWVSSAILRSRLPYRPWLKMHYIAYLLPPLLIIHAITVNDFTSSTFEFGLFIFWITIGLLYIVFVILRILTEAGFGKYKYNIHKISYVGEITILELQPVERDRFLLANPGQYAYLQLGKFRETHPFSVVSSSSDQLKFGIKAVGPFSKDVAKLKIGDTVHIDGPYGVFTSSGHNNQPKVIIAGGIGITPFVKLIKEHPENAILINCNRQLVDAPFRDQLKDALNSRYFDVLSRDDIEGEQIFNTRFSKSVLDSIVPDKNYSDYNYYICSGTPLLMATLEILNGIGVPQNQIDFEAFTM